MVLLKKLVKNKELKVAKVILWFVLVLIMISSFMIHFSELDLFTRFFAGLPGFIIALNGVNPLSNQLAEWVCE